MIIDCDYNLIADWRSFEWRTLDEVLPYPQYQSGAKDKEHPVYKFPVEQTSNPILALEFDILNKDGFGLKRGYYEIGTDEEYSYLMFIESGYIKAKIPIIKREVINKSGSDFEWAEDKEKNSPNSTSVNPNQVITVASRKIYTPPLTDKEKKKRKEKYKKGADPITYFHAKAYMEYDEDIQAYKLIWEKYNTRLIGIIKI